MQRRKFVIGLGSLAAGGAAATGTGAFSEVTATREGDVQIAYDGDAYLAMNPDTSSPNGDYAQWAGDGSGTLILDFSSSNNGVGGSGINNQAEFRADHVFTITNQGTQDVWVWFDDDNSDNSDSNLDDNEDVVGYPDSTNGPFDIWFYHYEARSPEKALDGAAGIVNLGPGDSSRIGVAINTDNGEGLGEYTVPVKIISDDSRPDYKETPEDVSKRNGF